MKKKLFWLTLIAVSIFSTFLLNVFEPVSARPGGGHSFRSSRHSFGKSYSGKKYFGSRSRIHIGGAMDPGLLIFIIIIFIIFYLKAQSDAKKGEIKIVTSAIKVRPNQNFEQQLEAFRQKDPDFSLTLFIDFVSTLYSEFYGYHGQKEIKNLAPYLSENDVLKAFGKNFRISEVVIGSLNITSISENEAYDIINAEIDANYTVNSDLVKIRHEVFERWQFHRKKGVNSKNPETMRNLSCPSCGGAHNFIDGGQCYYCGVQIKPGEMQWFLNKKNEVINRQFKLSLGQVQETGTNLPTVWQRNLRGKTSLFCQKYNITDWDSYWHNFKNGIVTEAFLKIYENWSKNKLEAVRFLLSARLYRSFEFWIKMYREEQLANKLENIQIGQIELVKVDLDKYYDSFTVRVFASCYDFIQNNRGTVVSGSKTNLRSFSEYWTFIRRAGLEKDVLLNGENCPACGSALGETGQSAKCGYCGSTINNGDFSWVLTLITQDEVYQG